MDNRERNEAGSSLNQVLGIAIGAANAVVDVLLLPGLILAFFVAELTPSYVTIGLVPAVGISLWTVARLPASVLTSTARRIRPWAFGASIVRIGAIAVLAVLASRTNPSNLMQSGRPLLIAFFLCFIVYTLASGFSSVLMSAMLDSSIPQLRRARFLRLRAVVSGALAIIAASIVARLLGAGSLDFPGNYGRLFFVAVVCLIAVAVFSATLHEVQPGRATRFTMPGTRLFAGVVADRRIWRYIVARFLLTSSAAIDPFLFLFVVTRLGMPISSIGQCALAGVLGWIVSSPFWIWLQSRSGPKSLLQGGSVLRLVAPIVALILPSLNSLPDSFDSGSMLGLSRYAILLAFATIGASLAAQVIAHPGYLSRLGDPRHPGAISGVSQTAVVVASFAPVIGGVVIQRYGYESLFAMTIVVGLGAVFASGLLVGIPGKEPRRLGDTAPEHREFPALPAPRA